jgi:hypothetical protein
MYALAAISVLNPHIIVLELKVPRHVSSSSAAVSASVHDISTVARSSRHINPVYLRTARSSTLTHQSLTAHVTLIKSHSACSPSGTSSMLAKDSPASGEHTVRRPYLLQTLGSSVIS